MKLGQLYTVWVYDSDTGSYHATEQSTSYAAARAKAYTEQLKHGLAYVEKPDGILWYPADEEETN